MKQYELVRTSHLSGAEVLRTGTLHEVHAYMQRAQALDRRLQLTAQYAIRRAGRYVGIRKE